MENEFQDWQDGELVVVKNQLGEYSIWPKAKAIPEGWENQGVEGNKQECLDYIKEKWVLV